MAKDELPGISDETREMIEDHVKKGKARKFFLIYKGATIKTLVVFRKGPFGPKIMKAKKDGHKGEVAYGVVTGSGKNLFFQLPGSEEVAAAMKVDSWEDKSPTKKSRLREFLAANGLKLKSDYYIIHDVDVAPNPDSELDVPLAPPPPGSAVADDEDDSPPPDGTSADGVASPDSVVGDESDPLPADPTGADSPEGPSAAVGADRFAARLSALKPDLERIVAAGTSAGADAKLRASEAAVFARKLDFEQANLLWDEVETLVARGLAEMDASAGAVNEQEKQFTARLKDILPRVKQAADTPVGDEAKRMAGEAGTLARARDFRRAESVLDRIEALLTSSREAPEVASSDEAEVAGQDAMSEFLRRVGELEPRLLAAQRADRDRATKLGAVWEYANEQARSNDFAKAFKAFDGLETAIEQILERDGSPSDTSGPALSDAVRLARGRLDWEDSLKRVCAQIRDLQEELAADDDPEFPGLEMKLDRVVDALHDQNSRLADLLDEVLNSDTPERLTRSLSAARVAAEEYLAFVTKDELLLHLLEHPYDSDDVDPNGELVGPLERLLKELDHAGQHRGARSDQAVPS